MLFLFGTSLLYILEYLLFFGKIEETNYSVHLTHVIIMEWSQLGILNRCH